METAGFWELCPVRTVERQYRGSIEIFERYYFYPFEWENTNNPNIESKGFLSFVMVRDLIIHDKVINLIVWHRHWLDLYTSKYFTFPYDDIKSENIR